MACHLQARVTLPSLSYCVLTVSQSYNLASKYSQTISKWTLIHTVTQTFPRSTRPQLIHYGSQKATSIITFRIYWRLE